MEEPSSDLTLRHAVQNVPNQLLRDVDLKPFCEERAADCPDYIEHII